MSITLSEFAQSLGDVSFPLAVAVSGGADSLALLVLAHGLAQQKDSHVVALTIDHGLRPESTTEALCVKKWAQERGIRHETLAWDGEKPHSRLQERARQARYDLLTQWCQQNQIATILLGHHQQDQEETFWLRLSAGSGLDGLIGMKKRIIRDRILFLRPLLDFPKERLKETLWAQNQEWIEDPSNQSSSYFRARLRHFLNEEGLSSSRLLGVMKKLQRDADFIQDSLQQAIETTVQIHEGGYLTLEKTLYHALHPVIAQRLISFVIQWFSSAPYPPRSTQVTGIQDKIKREAPFTAGGIYWVVSRETTFLFREKRAIKQEYFLPHLQENILWDQRFLIDHRLAQYVPKDIILRPLGSAPGLKKEVRSLIPARAWPMLPALIEKGKVVAVPQLCYDLLECGEDLRKFIYLKPLFHNSLRFTI